MEYRRLGRSGLQLSALSFGSWVTFSNQLDAKLAEECMTLAYESGVNFFDNAEVYASGQSEVIMGQVLQKTGWGRDTYVVSSKVFWGGQLPTQRGLSRKHIHDACHAALKRMQLDYLDLFFCHRPDIHTPVEETVWAMNDLIRQGKILYWGTSEWEAQQIMEAISVCRQYQLIPPTMEQPQYNMFHREKMEHDFLRLFSDYGLGTTIWSPLASGLLTGKYSAGIPADSRANLPGYEWLRRDFESERGRERIRKAQELQKLAEELGISLARMSIAWCIQNPNVSTVLLGASRASQLKETLKSLDDTRLLDDSVNSRIEDILDNRPSGWAEY